ncbi:MAG: RecQ family ATP-dependent DNA helicase [Bacteroidetes bacterium]|nr:RecQ family ATP-dependent DNA helicase [Bacteroidota bacterium]
MDYSSSYAHELLQLHFGYSQFRTGQEDIISSIVNKNNTLVIMPTGGGKSLCYQIPALICNGTALVISPLIALMKDQTDVLTKAKIPATFINSTLRTDDIAQILVEAQHGNYKLIYIAPERLSNRAFIEALKQIDISFIAVDEAHCISEWGHDFRPAYLEIAKTLETLPQIPIIALTATATPEVQEDIVRSLGMKSPKKIIKGFDRPNLNYIVENTNRKAERITDICNDTPSGSTIIYCGTRKRVEEFTETLRKYKLFALGYHAGLLDIHRKYAQEQFISGECKILVATSAFGMGIDKSDVRNVIHCDITLTLEAYYQEAGRAGRDDKSSNCFMLYHPTDRKLMEFFLVHTYPQIEHIKTIYNVLYDLQQTPIGMKPTIPMMVDQDSLSKRTGIHSASVGSILNLFQRHGIIYMGGSSGLASIHFTTTNERIKEYHRNTTSDRQKVLTALLRSVGAGALTTSTQIELSELFYKHEIAPEQFASAIRALEYARLIKYEPPAATSGISLTTERMPFENVPIDLTAFEARRERAYSKLDIVQRYAETGECKRNFILNYFHEDTHQNCGRCSSCLNPSDVPIKRSERQEFLRRVVLALVAEIDNRYGRTMIADIAVGATPAKIKQAKLTELENFGEAGDFSRKEVLEEIDKCISDQLLKLSREPNPTVSIVTKDKQNISNKQTIFIEQTHTQTKFDQQIFDRLTSLRMEISSKENIPPSMIFDNSTMMSIARLFPTTITELRSIQGINDTVITRYSSHIFKIVRERLSNSEIQDKHKKLLPKAVIETVKLVKQKKSIGTIASERDLMPAKIAQHIQEALEAGVELDRTYLFSNELYELVRSALQSQPRAILREIRSMLDGQYDFPELRIAVAFVRQDIARRRL